MLFPNLYKDTSDKTKDEVLKLIHTLKEQHFLSEDELYFMITNMTLDELEVLLFVANEETKLYYNDLVYMRGLIEISSYCMRNCNYCGIRKDIDSISRYHLDEDTILETIDHGYSLGFKTFVLQGGEDPYFTDEVICSILKRAKTKYNDIAITLSLGERSRESYRRMFEAGGDRYLLRHETITKEHYEYLHPSSMSYENRVRCLKDIKEIGYQAGCGIMVGSPKQTNKHLVNDLLFIHSYQPDMCGIGPYICSDDTPFKGESDGDPYHVIAIVAMVRLLVPHALIPATTALNTINKNARDMCLRGGGNIVMPNITPSSHKGKYSIYKDKKTSGSLELYNAQISAIGKVPSLKIGHNYKYRK